MEQRKLSEEEVVSFRTSGVVKVPAAVDPSWIPELLTVADGQLTKPSKWVNDVNPAASENRLFTDRYLWRHNDVIHRFVHDSGCARLAAQAMGSNSARFYFDHLLIKKVNTPTITPWHQDAPYWPFRGKQIASIWLALTPVTERAVVWNSFGVLILTMSTICLKFLEVPTTSRGNGRTSSKEWPCPISMPTGRSTTSSVLTWLPGMP